MFIESQGAAVGHTCSYALEVTYFLLFYDRLFSHIQRYIIHYFINYEIN